MQVNLNSAHSILALCAITNILGSIDKRIDISRKIVIKNIKILDYIFEYVFAKKQLYPNEPLSSFLQILSGYAFDSATYQKGKYKIATIKAIQIDNFDVSSADEIAEKPSERDEIYELKCGDVLISLTGNTGRMAIVDEQNTLLNQRVGKLLCDKEYLVYSYCLLHSRYMQQIIQRNSVGTSQKNLSPLVLQDTKIYKPQMQELQSFNNISVPIFNSLLNELKRIKSLTAYKSYLLPLLMNGQITLH